MTPTVLLLVVLATAGADDAPRWEPQDSGTRARLRGVCAVDGSVAWASGTGGTFTRTADGGKTWRDGQVPGAEGLDFRDVEAFDAQTAVLLAAGPGDQSRIYRTADGGKTWSLRFTNPDKDGFLDALAFWDADHGLALGDPVGGRFRIVLTDDGGTSWRLADPAGMPEALDKEGAFAASGTCLVAARGTRRAWFGTGGAEAARVFRTTDGGRTWGAASTPIPAGKPSSGIFSLTFTDPDHGLAVGGDYKEPARPGPYFALSRDGGATWDRAPRDAPGFRSGIAPLPGTQPASFVTVGPTGSEFSPGNDGASWTSLGPLGFHAVSLIRGPTGWAVGDDGHIARLVVPPALKERP
jgi:photosystem II stability/assembly factor-like uncharacterized protein